MTEPTEKPEDAPEATTEETVAFDDGTEATDEIVVVPSPVPGVKTP